MTQTAAQANSRTEFRSLWLPALLCLVLLFLELYYLLYNIEQPIARVNPTAHGPPLATLQSLKSEVRQKNAGTVLWSPPETGQFLYREDAIATMANAEAVVTFSDLSEIVIEPNSLIIFEQAPVAGAHGETKIVARLAKGSIKRKGTGKSPLFVKFSSSPNALPVRFDDRTGGSVFRVVYKAHGVEVVVESGTIAIDEKQEISSGQKVIVEDGKVQLVPVKEPLQQLPPPKLKKPTIEIENQKGTSSQAPTLYDRIIACLLWDRAFAESTTITIRFAWDSIQGASSYLIQVSEYPDFHSIFLEKKVMETQFPFQTTRPEVSQFLYFRVAGINPEGSLGQFSSVEHVEITPQEKPPEKSVAKIKQTEPVQAPPKKAEIPVRPPEIKTFQPPPALPPPARISQTSVQVPRDLTRFDFGYGAQYHHRTLKDDVNPKEATGSGIVPGRFHAELTRLTTTRHQYTLGGTYLLEVAQPKVDSPGDSKLKSPVLKIWGTYGWQWNGYTINTGPYVTNSTHIKAQGLTFVADQPILLGAILKLEPNPASEMPLYWGFQLGAIAIGAVGVDFSFSIKHPLWNFRMFRPSSYRGLFVETDLETRISSIESAWAATLEIGYSF